MAITHDSDAVIEILPLVEKVYLPQAVSQVLKSFGLESLKDLTEAMKSRYSTATNSP